ncbi:LamG domain-containing protein [Gammaproteobacteria bacterium]|nr:LamG domain-containing protein [Gammaproteobacteria bacterium]
MSSLFSLSASAANVLAFDGNNDFVRDLEFSPGIFAKIFTVELWFKSDAVNQGYLVQSASTSLSSPEQKIQYSMRLEAGGSVIAGYGGNGSYVSAASSSSYDDGNWHHAAMTLDSSGLFTLYIDGAAVATDSYVDNRPTLDNLAFYLGVLTSTSSSNSSYFKGQMRDVRVWVVPRSAAEVLATKDATLAGAEVGLAAWYTLDQGVGGGTSTSTSTIIDSFGRSHLEPLNFTMGGTESNFVTFVDNTDLDASLTAAAGVAEPVAIPTTVDTVGEALDVFDFTLTDGGTADALALGVSQVVVNVSGTATDAQRSQITWRLNGPDASNVTGSYSAGADTLTFSGLSISVADGTSEVYTVNAYFNDNTSLTDNATVILSVDGDTDLTVLGAGTSMAATTAVTNGTGTLTTVAATRMVYAPEPAGSSSGSALTTQPIVRALDAAGNLDTDFIETVTLSSTGSGTLSGDIDITAVGGVATFSGVIYSAAVDRESIVFSADDEAVGIDLAAITSSAISSEVTATRLVFQVQPNPRFAYSGSSITFASAITVAAVDAIGAVDADFTGSVVLSEVGGAGATEIIFAADTDGDITTATMSAVAGVASFSGLSFAYSSGTEGDEVYFIAANSAAFAEVRSESLSSSPAPPPVDPTIRDKVTRTGTSTDPEIAEGGELTGGEVCGDAISEGKITDVTLCGGATITGGEVGGEIIGDPDDPATLSGVTVLPGSRLSNVNIGADVILLKGVIIGGNVGFASFLNMPSGVALTNTLSFIVVPGREGQTALDLRGESIAGAATAPRTSYLDLVAEVPEFEEPGAAIKQQPQGEIEMEFSDSEARMVPIRITKTDTPDADEVGFSYDDDGNLSIRLPSLLEIIMYPMFTDDDALLAAIKKEDPAYGLKYGADSYFEITKDTETGLAATLPRYVGRPRLSAVKLASGTERELGFFTYPSPFLANVNAVSLITRNDVGALMEQEMVPAPSDWLLFKTRVLKEGRVSRVSIDPRGVITIRETAGYEFRVLADYAVIPNAVFSKEGRPIVFINAGDLNANGEDDYYSYYPNGDRQTLYVFPQ